MVTNSCVSEARLGRRGTGALLGLVALLVLHIPVAFAEGFLTRVTKETQPRLGLNFTLAAERVSNEVVLVQMEIPRQGKLRGLRSVRMTLGKTKAVEDGSPMLSAPLKTTQTEKGSWVVRFQLSPELAEKCSVDLDVPTDRLSYEIYAVELKGYITERL